MPNKNKGRFSINDIAEDVDKFTSKAPPATWTQYSGKKAFNADEAEAALKRPTLMSDPAGWWAALSDEEKQGVLDAVGEMAGGTVGAIVGGGPTPLGVIGAGAGAVGGRGVARSAGRAMGLNAPLISESAKTVADSTGIDPALAQVIETFSTNSGAEFGGRSMPLVGRGAKSITQRALKKVINPDQNVIRLAEQAGVQLTPGMASKNTLTKLVETGLEKLPGGTSVIRDKTMAAVEPWEKSLKAIPNKLNPTPVTTPEAGQALQSALSNNRGAASAFFKPRYEAINRTAGDAPIDLSAFRDDAASFLDDLPANLEGYFPAAVLQKMRQAANVPDGQMIAPGQMIDGNAPIITFREAQQMRTALLEAERAMKTGDAAIKRKGIPILRDSLDRAITDSLGGSPNPTYQQALQDWRAVNQEFSGAAQKLYPSGKQGNATAGTIEGARLPENLPPQIANKPTAIEEATTATAPMFGAPNENAMGKLARERTDHLIQDSKTQNRFIADQRIVNPRRLEKSLDDSPGLQELTKPVSLDLRDSITLGKAITSPTQLTNTSETARIGQLIGYGTLAAGGTAGLALGDGEGFVDAAQNAAKGIAAAYVMPKLAAKAWTGPVARAVTKPTQPLISGPAGGPLLGAAGRGIMQMQKLQAPPPIDEEQPVRRGRFTLNDIQ
jgi:hypothetical protein